MRKKLSKVMALICVATITVTSMPYLSDSTKGATMDFSAENSSVMVDKGGYKKEVYGVGTDDWGVTWTDRKNNLPTRTTYLTDNYKETVGTVPTNDWASSVVFDKYSESLYAHPLAYRVASNGMQMASPAVTSGTSYVDGEPTVESLLEDNTVELVIGGNNFSAKDAKVDKTTDWTYDILMENNASTSSIMATIGKGTPYAYYTFKNVEPTISLGAGGTDLAIYKNSTSSNILGVSLKNKKDGKTHYYLISAPSGTTWVNAGGKLTAKMPTGKSYMSVAILPDGSDNAFELYKKYAFNFITDTKVEWKYLSNSSKVVTKYNVVTKNMEIGANGGDTIIALYPHQWRYANSKFTGYTYETIRGTMKTVVGTSYSTTMQYNGILSSLPVTKDEETVGKIKDQLGYLYSYRKSKDNPKWICFLEGQYGGYDTYWVGKNLNTLSDAIWLADQFKDNDMKTMTNDMVEGVEDYLEFWFDPHRAYIDGQHVDDYFYYDKEYGTLIGYPTSYDSDKQVNDHHFHYGYWIKAAAAVAMKDPQWAKEWGGMVYEMIGDIANANRDGSSYNKNSETRYPFLRNFDIYEGHSWASGVANYEFDENGVLAENGGLSGGNNQESSSESVNAWSSLILWGEAVGDERIRDLGIYMYTTEIAAIEDYYYDVHNEIFTKEYKDSNNYNIQTVTRLFGGRYDHTAWWTENPIEVTTITMLPISGATFYMGKYKEKVKAVVDSIGENSKQWSNFVNNKEQICTNYGKKDMLTDPKTNQDVVAEYYAYYDPDAALAKVDLSDSGKVENGESRAHTLAYITSLKEYGNQNFDITGSTPFSVVLEKNGVKTYVVENHTDKTQRTYFSDKTYVDVPANSVYAGVKSGDGENPNKDDSQETTKPEATTAKPEATTQKPQETTKPEATTVKPETTTQKHEVTTKQETTKPATDDSKYASLNYIDIGNNKNNEFDQSLSGCKYAVVNGTINVCQFQNTGFGELYMAVGGISAANFTATINGQKVTRTEGTGLFINPAVDYITYKYNVVEITADDGTATVIIMNPNKTGTYNESSIIETTTEKQSETTTKEETTSKVETTTEKQSETTTKEETTSKVETTTEKQNETTTKEEATSKVETTTEKQNETTTKEEATTKEETTTKKQEETVSKEQTTTDKLNESTTEQIQVTTKDEIKENQSTKDNKHSDVTTTANKEGFSTGGVGNGEKYQAPGKVKKLKVKKKSLKKIRLSWKKVSGANGYQVSVKVRKKGKFKVVKTIRKNKNKYIRRKYRNKIIYVKVRAYKIVAGNKIYGKYSAVKKYKNK
ncbi:glycosyl hydrolase [uncultured Eubacterium sp.]|uniref:glycosyl hydrolase n=1 Tax=uncultured Eubacterium sp. TaxID=165185 RepID=UPI0032659EAE